ncbi:MAG: ACP S-malonyltransferase [Lachnospiraceae bacterium]|nr:ACP S-malonyltransferase [Ruminococcus sp.]MCM1274172.1 ACP S-malonyltransferase [Lachnospiraceae bacterium]
MKTAFLFSGQGSQYPGMGAELAERYGAAKEILECGSDVLGCDLLQKLTGSTAEELAQTRLSQPAIFTASLIALCAVRENGVENAAVAGHSLGEYAAMYASGMLSLEDAFKAIKLRSEAMAKAAGNAKGAMAAIIGADSDMINEVCGSVEGFVAPANYNSPVQTVIAGEESAVDAAMAKFAELGKRGVKLAVSAAFHTKLMQPAADEFKAAAQGFAFREPNCAFYANLYGKRLEDFSDMPSYLAAHICSPVKFADELNAMQSDGIEAFVELGPNKVLTGLVKKTLKDVVNVNVENNETLEKALSALKG